MTVAEIREKCKRGVGALPRDLLIIAILIAASLLSFGLGYLAGGDAQRATTLTVDVPDSASLSDGEIPEQTLRGDSGRVVASKNGTKFYLPSCAGASRISDANKVWFASANAAVHAGYSPSANCSGL